jgi:hypothetical protein
VDRIAAEAKEDLSQLKDWFDTIMDRTTERFVTHTRYFTFGMAAFLALVLQIDSLGILKQISGNPELRARLVHDADATLKLAEGKGAKSDALATKALEEAKGERRDASIPAVAADLVTRADGENWISGNVNVKDDSAQRAFTGVFEKHYDALLSAKLKEVADSAAVVTRQLSGTELVVMDPKGWDAWVAWWGTDTAHRLPGVLLTIVFLSLGGPFWYNLLRQLANLRPLLAGKVDADEQA